MEGLKCGKCGGINETYQRGDLITGTRCLACGYETLAKICRNVSELKAFFEKVPESTQVLFGDELASLKLEAHFSANDMERTDRIKVWKGSDK